MFRFKNCRPAWALIVLLAIVRQSWADTQTFTGNAHDVRQITTLTVGGTWLDTETATMTINGKDIVVTLVGAEATTAVATGLKNAWMSATRLDGSGTPDATSNVGGQEFGEFSEVTATASGSVVTLTANEAGVPFVVTVAETSATGTLTPATPQAATGKQFWNNADNWDTGAAPVNDDVVVFRYPGLHCRYGLPNGTLEVTVHWYHSADGELGLPPINIDNPAKPYAEYRQQYVRLDDAGTGLSAIHRIGIGQAGRGSSLINLKHSTLPCVPIVYNTGQPLSSRPGTYALNLCCTNNTSSLTINNGWVDFSSQDGGTSAWLQVDQNAGNSRGIQAIHTASSTLNVSGGAMLIGGTGAITTINVSGGTVRLESQTGTITTLNSTGGILECITAGTITTLYVNGGTFDATNASAFSVGTGTVYHGSRFLDPTGKMVVDTAFRLAFEPSDDLQFGANVNNLLGLSP